MAELRWALVGLGTAFLVGLALWEWRRSRRRLAQVAPEPTATGGAPEERVRRIEPRFDSLDGQQSSQAGSEVHDVPVIHPTEPPASLSVPVAREVAVDLPAAAAPPRQPPPQPQPPPPPPPPPPKPQSRAIRWPPERADRVLTLRLVSTSGALLAGREVRLALEQAGLVPGPQNIYHLADAQGAVLASAANMLRPGDLDPLKIDEEQLRGLSLFSVLPGALTPVRMLEELVAVARAVSWRLGATVQDEHGAELDGDVLIRLRQSLPDGPEQDNG